MISTEGFGAAGSMRLARSTPTSSSSPMCIERAQPAQCVKPHGGQAVGLDRRHVGAGSFDAQDLDLLAEVVGMRVFNDVLPPPCSTSFGSRPRRRVV